MNSAILVTITLVVVALVSLALITAIIILLRRGKAEATVESLEKAKKFEAAAALAEERGDLNRALELFILAKLPARAGEMAYALGRLRQAAELFAESGDQERASRTLEEGGLSANTHHVAAQLAAPTPSPLPRSSPTPPARKDAPSPEQNEGSVPPDRKPERKRGRQHQSAGAYSVVPKPNPDNGIGQPIDAEPPAKRPRPTRDVADLAIPTPPPLTAEVDVDILKGRAARESERPSKPVAQGLELRPIAIELAVDELVETARSGPSVSELKKLLDGQQPDLGNIEVYYRLGLALTVAGRWREAFEAFASVEGTSPGYRDANARADELAAWIEAVDIGASKNSAAPERYQLQGELGRGGMAVVYRAKDTALGRAIALKFLSEEFSHQELVLQLFQREARAAAQLNHPKIITLYDVGQHRGRAFIAMELVTGRNIEQLLDERGKLPLLEATRIAKDILDALDYAHEKNIVHRDIKPSNVMISDNEETKLMDFGLAKQLQGKARTTMVAGTPLYMAPEQFTGKNIGPTTDVFAAGATIYEMLTGQPPFEGMRRDIPPRALNEFLPDAPRDLVKLVHKSLEIEQERRFADAGAMLKPLRRALSALQS